jgi:hypothetical protein
VETKLKNMKAILIDSKSKTVRYVEVKVNDGSALESMYNHIDCDLVEVINIDDKNDLFVDEEGLLKLNKDSQFFLYDGFPQPLAGNGLILGLNQEEGESVETSLSIEEVAEKVLFLDINTVKEQFC